MFAANTTGAPRPPRSTSCSWRATSASPSSPGTRTTRASSAGWALGSIRTTSPSHERMFQSLKSQLRVQLAPSIEHQVSAMVAIMVRWVSSSWLVLKGGSLGLRYSTLFTSPLLQYTSSIYNNTAYCATCQHSVRY